MHKKLHESTNIYYHNLIQQLPSYIQTFNFSNFNNFNFNHYDINYTIAKFIFTIFPLQTFAIIFSFNRYLLRLNSFKLQSPEFNNLSFCRHHDLPRISRMRAAENIPRAQRPRPLSRTAAQVSLAGFFRWRALVAV